MKKLVALTSTSLVLGLGAFAGTASADYLNVVIPCGCHPLGGFQTEQTGQLFTQQVGVSSDSPATSNPSGTAGNADDSSGLGLTGGGLTNPSGQAQFCSTSDCS